MESGFIGYLVIASYGFIPQVSESLHHCPFSGAFFYTFVKKIMAISTSSIFHYTKKFDILKSILKEGFRITYCLEEYNIGLGQIGIGVAMVSFADIPLIQVQNSGSNYGRYCIGLSKKWASLNRINPILYMEQNSVLSEYVFKFLHLLDSDPNINKKYKISDNPDGTFTISYIKSNEEEISYNLMNSLFSNIKNSNGILARQNKKIISDYNFYAEREWRYVPTEQDLIKNQFNTQLIIPKETYLKWRERTKEKEFFPRISLTFTSDDINHIIVEKEVHIPSLIKFLKVQSHLYSNSGDIDVLISRITSFERLKADF
jgi:Putative abortive phage resistance protein AbiGi, antitoxin